MPANTFIFLLSVVIISILIIVLATSIFKFNIFLSIFLTSLLLAIVALPIDEVIPVIATGFGNTLRSVGLIIIFGIILGLLLDKSGAAYGIAKAILKLTGKENSGLAMHLTGFLTGIPIFCDSGFIVLQGINRTVSLNSGKPMVFMATVLAAGLYSIHCLIPPHPGATAAAGIMGANIGHLIFYGIPIAFIAATSGFWMAKFLTKKEFKSEYQKSESVVPNFDMERLPSTFMSLLPIIVPLILLSVRSVVLLFDGGKDNYLFQLILLMGDPIIALLVGIGIALTLFRRLDKKSVNELFDIAIEKAGPILAITAAGGIFGAVIKATGVGETAGTYLATTGLGLFIPFVIAAFLKTAQGSSTVAILTAASIVAPMLPALGYDSGDGILLATLAMGAGSMMISHTNDSYFWVITKFSDLEAHQTLKTFSPVTFVMGMVAFFAVIVLSVFIL